LVVKTTTIVEAITNFAEGFEAITNAAKHLVKIVDFINKHNINKKFY
jgi:uncharacterized protein with PhoU and TrkA domain